MSVRERIAAVIQPLKEEVRELQNKRSKLQSELAQIDRELDEALEFLDLLTPKQKPAAAPKLRRAPKQKRRSPITTEVRDARVFEAMNAKPLHVWTTPELIALLDMDKTTMRRALDSLTEAGKINNLGTISQPPGYSGRLPIGYMVADGATPSEPTPSEIEMHNRFVSA